MTTEATATVHDFTRRKWGHDYTFEPIDTGLRGHMSGWKMGIREGDYLILRNGEATTRYQVETIRYMTDPRDQWFADVRFAPRSNA